ncbi:MAG: hypothetical protein CUN49_11725, partial [Candidatus Thermofonsia Clade 1 bacterium]
VAYSPDRLTLAAGERAAPRSAVHLWHVRTGERLSTIKGIQGQLASLAFSADGGLLAVGAGNGRIELWDVARQALIVALGEPNMPAQQLVSSLTFSADGTLLATADGPDRVTLWAVP